MQPPTNLTEAEERLLTAVQDGEPADFTGSDPMATLWAHVIRAFCVKTGPNEKIEAKRISIRGATIVGVLDLEGLALNFPLRLTGCVLEERPIFSGTKLDLLDLSGTRCLKGINAAYLEVTTDLILGEDFSAEGDVRLYGAKIHGDLICTGGRFVGGEPTTKRPVLDVEGATIDGSALLRRGFTAEGKELPGFAAEGEVRFSRAKIGGTLDCSGGSFTARGDHPALSAIGADIRGSTFLRDRFTAKGEVSLYAAKIGGGLDCGNGAFMNPDATALNATGAGVGGFLTWREVTGAGRIILEHASVNQLADQAASWPVRGELFLNGFEYEGIARGAPRDASTRLDWLQRQSEFTPQPYEHLVVVLRRIGLEEEARTVAIAKQERLLESGLLPSGGQAWNRFLGYVVVYGYKPSRAFVVALSVVLLGWLAFSAADWAEIMVPAKETASGAHAAPPGNSRQLPDNSGAAATNPRHGDHAGNNRPLWSDSALAAVSSLVYSLDVFLPVVNLHEEENRLPDRSKLGWAFRAYMGLHILAGWTLTTILVAALAGLIKKD